MPEKKMSPETFIASLRGRNGKKGLGQYIKDYWMILAAIAAMLIWGIRLEGKVDASVALIEAVVKNTEYRVEQTSPAFIELQKENRRGLLEKYSTDDERREAIRLHNERRHKK